MEQRKHYLFNYAFIGSLLLLVLNDHIFKAAFHNGITGKLSDFAGMVVLPLLLAFLFPKLKTGAVWLSMLFFAFWKSPLSESVIDVFNAILPFKMGRIVDYTDLFAVLIVPLPYFIIRGNASLNFLEIRKVKLNPAYLVLPTLVALIATTPPPYHFERHYRPATGNIDLKSKNISVKVRLSPQKILEKLRAADIRFKKDTVAEYPTLRGPDSDYGFYKIDRLIIDKDTLKDIQFSMIPKKEGSNGDGKTKVYLNSLTIEKDLTDQEVKEKMVRYYKKLLKKYFNQLD